MSSSTSSNWISGTPLPQQARQLPAQTASPFTETKLTWTGIILAVICLLVTLSAYERFRIVIGSLYVHPYLVLLFPVCVVMIATRLGDFPQLPLLTLAGFSVMFVLSTLSGPSPAGESMKLLAGVTSIVTAALLVRSEKDFRVGSAALMIAMALMSVRGLMMKTESFVGANPLDKANENAFSLYTLAPLLLSAWIAMDKKASKFMRATVLGSALLTVVTMFSNANRSGWLCAGLIPFLLFKRGGPNKMRLLMSILVIFLIGGATVYLFADRKLIEYRMSDENKSGQTSDTRRIDLLLKSASLALKNPISGVGPQNVLWELGMEMKDLTHGGHDPHNVFGYVMAGSGLITFSLMMTFGVLMYRKPLSLKLIPKSLRNPEAVQAHNLVQAMLLLWVARGSFSREILYSPGFGLGMGLAIGLAISAGIYRKPKSNAQLVPAGSGSI